MGGRRISCPSISEYQGREREREVAQTLVCQPDAGHTPRVAIDSHPRPVVCESLFYHFPELHICQQASNRVVDQWPIFVTSSVAVEAYVAISTLKLIVLNTRVPLFNILEEVARFSRQILQLLNDLSSGQAPRSQKTDVATILPTKQSRKLTAYSC